MKKRLLFRCFHLKRPNDLQRMYHEMTFINTLEHIVYHDNVQ
jgi:hypothetical protein